MRKTARLQDNSAQAAHPDGTEGAASIAESSAAGDAVEAEAQVDGSDETGPAKLSTAAVRMAMIVGMVFVLTLAALTGWLGYRSVREHQAEAQRNVFLEVGRQAALNLTTIDWQNSDTGIERILDSATGNFYDDFQQRAQPFIDAVKQARATSVRTIAESGIEKESPVDAQVLVAVSVKSSSAVVAEENSRTWRMRISLRPIGDQTKVSGVEFVP